MPTITMLEKDQPMPSFAWTRLLGKQPCHASPRRRSRRRWFESLERRDLLNGSWDGCVVETGPDGQHHITGSCEAMGSGGSDSGGSGGSSGSSDGGYGSGWGTDSNPWESGLDPSFFENLQFGSEGDDYGCQPLADGTIPHYCYHDGQMVYPDDGSSLFGGSSVSDPSLEAHCSTPAADGTIPHYCFQGGQIVYPGEYQEANDYPSEEPSSGDSGREADDANPWYNLDTPTDINDDGSTSPQDALILVNDLNSFGSRHLILPTPSDGEGESAAKRFLDANNDDWVSPTDVLAVVNRLNQATLATLGGEGEDQAAEENQAQDSDAPALAQSAGGGTDSRMTVTAATISDGGPAESEPAGFTRDAVWTVPAAGSSGTSRPRAPQAEKAWDSLLELLAADQTGL
ncbi:MAG: dockerin type I domain-containing protein [Pirellulaceae bacterium]